MKNLYLFDIDGTLVDMMLIHVNAYKMAYKEVTGTLVSKRILVGQFGNTESRIHQYIFGYYELSNKNKIKEVIKKYTSHIIRSIRGSNVKVLPGVLKLLKDLEKNGHLLGVVTGNSKTIGKSILKKSGLYDYFEIFSYGELNKRSHIVRNAIKIAKKRKKFEKVIVIGDTPFDIRAGKANRAITVGVATGRCDFNEIKSAKPDVALRSLKNYSKILRISS